MKKKHILLACIMLLSFPKLNAQSNNLERNFKDIEQKVIDWRRDIHQNPELGNREFRTATLVAKHLRSLGMEVKTEVGVTGVIGVLKGGLPGPVVALRADMDALPVLERKRNCCNACLWARFSCSHSYGCCRNFIWNAKRTERNR